jgi:hypothetical protein
LQSLHARSVDHCCLSAISFRIAEVEVVVLERADPYFPDPRNLASAGFSPLVPPVRVSENIAEGQVRPRLDKMPFGLVVLEGYLDLDVLAASAATQ